MTDFEYRLVIHSASGRCVVSPMTATNQPMDIKSLEDARIYRAMLLKWDPTTRDAVVDIERVRADAWEVVK